MKLSRFFDQVGLVPMISGIVSFWDAIVFAVWGDRGGGTKGVLGVGKGPADCEPKFGSEKSRKVVLKKIFYGWG